MHAPTAEGNCQGYANEVPTCLPWENMRHASLINISAENRQRLVVHLHSQAIPTTWAATVYVHRLLL